MITNAQLFQAKPHTELQARAAANLLVKVNALRGEWASKTMAELAICPNTGSEISGSKGGAGDGGFRLRFATTGGEHTSHKILWSQRPDGTWYEDLVDPKAGVDCFDPGNKFDQWLDIFEDGHGGNSKLEEYDLYREHPSATDGWAHLTDRAPHSGHRTFMP